MKNAWQDVVLLMHGRVFVLLRLPAYAGVAVREQTLLRKVCMYESELVELSVCTDDVHDLSVRYLHAFLCGTRQQCVSSRLTCLPVSHDRNSEAARPRYIRSLYVYICIYMYVCASGDKTA